MESEKLLRLRERFSRLTVVCPGCGQTWLAPGLAGGDDFVCKGCGASTPQGPPPHAPGHQFKAVTSSQRRSVPAGD